MLWVPKIYESRNNIFVNGIRLTDKVGSGNQTCHFVHNGNTNGSKESIKDRVVLIHTYI